MKRFSFANLMSRGARAEGDGYDDDQAMDDEDDTATEDQQEDDAASDDEQDDKAADDDTPDGDDGDGGQGDGSDDDDDDGSDEPKDEAAKARRAERARIGAILSGPSVGAHNFAQAAEIACNTTLSPKQAAAVLKSGTSASAGGGLAAAMRGRQPAAPGRGASNRSSGKSSADLMKQRFAQKG